MTEPSEMPADALPGPDPYGAPTEGENGAHSAAEAAEPPTEDMTPERQAQARVQTLQEAADIALADGAIYAATVPEGEVRIQQITSHTDGLGAWWVDVWLAGAILTGEPGFRIYNPPLLVADPQGDVEVGGTMYRMDPMLALAQVIGINGGATKPRRR